VFPSRAARPKPWHAWPHVCLSRIAGIARCNFGYDQSTNALRSPLL
jgi:hypothetical protein